MDPEPHLTVTFNGRVRYGYDSNAFRIDYNETLQLLQDQKTIETALVQSARNIDPDSDAGVQLDLSIARVRRHFDRLYQTIPPLKRPATDESAAKAQEVFSTPELLEHIQSYLPLREKLTSMGVQRCWRDSVNGSVMLKRAMGLEPFDKSANFFYTAFQDKSHLSNWWIWWNHGWFEAKFPIGDLSFVHLASDTDEDSDDDDVVDGQSTDESPATPDNEVTVKLEISSAAPLAFGSRIRKMLIISGPVLSRLHANIRPVASYVDAHSNFALDTITSSSPHGLTVGELVDQVAEMRKKLQCRNEYIHHVVTFTASLTLDHNDPLLMSIRCHKKARQESQRAHHQRILDAEEEYEQDGESLGGYEDGLGGEAEMDSEIDKDDVGLQYGMEDEIQYGEEEESGFGDEQEEMGTPNEPQEPADYEHHQEATRAADKQEEPDYPTQQQGSDSEYQRAEMGFEDEQDDMGAGGQLQRMSSPNELREPVPGYEQEGLDSDDESLQEEPDYVRAEIEGEFGPRYKSDEGGSEHE